MLRRRRQRELASTEIRLRCQCCLGHEGDRRGCLVCVPPRQVMVVGFDPTPRDLCYSCGRAPLCRGCLTYDLQGWYCVQCLQTANRGYMGDAVFHDDEVIESAVVEEDSGGGSGSG